MGRIGAVKVAWGRSFLPKWFSGRGSRSDGFAGVVSAAVLCGSGAAPLVAKKTSPFVGLTPDGAALEIVPPPSRFVFPAAWGEVRPGKTDDR